VKTSLQPFTLLPAGDAIVVQLAPSLAFDSEASAALDAQLLASAKLHAPGRVLVNVAGVPFLPSSLLGLLALLHRRGVRICISHASESLHELLTTMKLDRLFQIDRAGGSDRE
jgi:anti-anti-sigma regulatory factor